MSVALAKLEARLAVIETQMDSSRRSHVDVDYGEGGAWAFLLLPLVLILVFARWNGLSLLHHISSSLLLHISVVGFTLVCSGLTLLFGLALYLFRCRHRMKYGIAESIAAVLTSGNTAWQFLIERDDNPTLLFGLGELGALYIFVRGLDNLHLGLSDAAKEKWELRFYGRVLPRYVQQQQSPEAAPRA